MNIPPPTLKGRINPRWLSQFKDETGRRRTLSFGTAASTTRDEAIDRWRQATIDRRPRGRKGVTLADVIDAYTERVVSTHVGKDAHYALQPFRDALGDMPIEAISAHVLEDWRDRLATEKRRAVSTINRRINCIKLMLRWGKRRRLVPDHVWGDIEDLASLKRPIGLSHHPPPRRAPSENDVRAVIDDFRSRGRLIGDMIELQMLTGMRSGDLCGMDWAMIDESRQPWLYSPDKHKTAHLGKERVIFLGPRCRAILERYRGREAMFVTQYGNPFTPHAYAQTIEEACLRLGVKHWVPHQLRHWLASHVARTHGKRAAADMIGDTEAVARQVYIHSTGEVAEAVS